jgi:pyruvoyl-dependent arginine decarboxylase
MGPGSRIMFKPSWYFRVVGTGVHKEVRPAIQYAMKAAGIGRLNLSKVSSVLAPNIQEVLHPKVTNHVLTQGECVSTIYALTHSNEPGTKVTAALCQIRTKEPGKVGFITEIEGIPGIQEDEIRRRVEQAALKVFAIEYDVELDEQTVWEPGKTEYKIGDEEVVIDTLAQTAEVPPSGDYAVAFVAAILL